VGAWTSLLAALYLVWQRETGDRALAAGERLRSIQRTQLVARRMLVEQELIALQAQIDPELLFGTIDGIQALYASEPARAEALLDELIAYLRAALPQHAGGCSTLAREIEVAGALVRMHRVAQGHDVTLVSEVEGALLRVPMTAGLLLPLFRGTLDACQGPARLSFGAHVTPSGVLELQLKAPLLPDDACLSAVAAALLAVHGTAACLLRSAAAVHLRRPHAAG
jgi:hypothetical protein